MRPINPRQSEARNECVRPTDLYVSPCFAMQIHKQTKLLPTMSFAYFSTSFSLSLQTIVVYCLTKASTCAVQKHKFINIVQLPLPLFYQIYLHFVVFLRYYQCINLTKKFILLNKNISSYVTCV